MRETNLSDLECNVIGIEQSWPVGWLKISEEYKLKRVNCGDLGINFRDRLWAAGLLVKSDLQLTDRKERLHYLDKVTRKTDIIFRLNRHSRPSWIPVGCLSKQQPCIAFSSCFRWCWLTRRTSWPQPCLLRKLCWRWGRSPLILLMATVYWEWFFQWHYWEMHEAHWPIAGVML